MRGALLMVVAVQVLAGTSCASRVVPADGPVVTITRGPECKLDEKSKEVCTNLLPNNWEQLDLAPNALKGLQQTVRTMVPLNQGTIVQSREIAADCAKGKPGEKDSIMVGYQVPAEAMKVFPTTGTGTRDLVIGVMEEKQPSNNSKSCWSARYSVQEKLGSEKRDLIFLTVRTEAAEHIDGVNRQVGRWRSWTIAKVKGKYELVNTGTGAFVSCAHKHFIRPEESSITHQFINCEKVTRIMEQAKLLAGDPTRQARDAKVPAGDPTSSAVAVAFDKLMLAYRVGSAEGVRNTGFTDSAWSRCGNLGCCAAE